ncbi:MAG: L-2-hydroxyglutarate oxidase [Vampirovibrionales bacterium]|nr:L-2-hydroxyglutarate oxidase [Vampirovibrionales bacterium]
MIKIDTLIIGGGIVGLATAHALLQQQPGYSIAVVEKEPELAQHQTGRNSGVIHSGLYYAPGSLKATLCATGRHMMEAFCTEESIDWRRCGKLIVATTTDELPRLQSLYERGLANGLALQQLTSKTALQQYEPHVTGLAGLWVPETGVVNYALVAQALAKRITAAGGTITLGATLTKLVENPDGLVVTTVEGHEFHCQRVINCGGLYSDRLFKTLSGVKEAKHFTQPSLGGSGGKIIPFRGEYYALSPEAAPLVKGLIYPVPNPQFPFLGVHLSRKIDDTVKAGPNAVLALAREGYTKTNINLRDALDALTYEGFWRVALNYTAEGVQEMLRSTFKPLFVKALQRLVPEVQSHHLTPYPAGIRAQALRPNGSLVDDFWIEHQGRVLHVLNAPSPAATASLAIGQYVAQQLNPHSL